MAKFSSLSSPKLFFLILFAGLTLISVASAHEFDVGGAEGWINPREGNVSESYNHWARRNRFHIGDSVYFKYSNDSVLVVNRKNYHHCNTTSPLQKFTDGNTTVQFDRHGFFYFISGQPDHCKSGQKLIIRVMVHPKHENAAPSPAPNGSEAAAPSHSGAWKLAAGSNSVVMATFSWAALFLTMFVV